MGQTLRRYKSERTEKARSKRRLIHHLLELGEYIELLKVEREHLENRVIDQDQAPHLESKSSGEACLTTRTDDVYTCKDRESLKREITMQENSLYATKKTYESLKKDLSRLLKEKRDLQRKNSSDQSRLAVSKERLKAFQEIRRKKGNPKDTWKVSSLPNLYCTKFPSKAKQSKV